MHFNRKKSDDIYFDKRISNSLANNNRLIAIDNIRVDDQTRLTFTKRIKNVFPVISGDILAVYQDIVTKDLIVNVQREEKIVDSWIMKRNSIEDNTVNNSFSAVNSNLKFDKSLAASYPNYVVTTKTTYKSNQEQKKHNSIYNILIVDDEEDVLLSYSSYLSSEAYHIETFTESREALRHFIELNNPLYYQLAIIDIRMPGINGVQLYQILKIMDSNVKVLFVSALDAAEELMSIFPGIRSKDIIRKPIIEENFLEKVNEIISSA